MHRLVRSASLTNFAEIASQCGLNARALLAEVGLPASCLANPDLKIDAQTALVLLEEAAARAREPAFGLRMGEYRRVSNIGPLAVALRDEPTLQHVLNVLVSYIRLHNEALKIQIQPSGNLVVIKLDILSDQGRRFRQGIELALLVTLRNIGLFMGSNWQPKMVCFAHPPPNSMAVHRRIFRIPIEFNHDFDGIVCNRDDLYAPNPGADPVLARYAEQFLQSLPGTPVSFQDQVRELVLLLLPLGQCHADVVAQHLGCDRRTVNRRLAKEGLSFLRLVDGHRRNIARQYVDEGSLTLAKIASHLGFSSRVALSRWYRKQFGVSPRGERI